MGGCVSARIAAIAMSSNPQNVVVFERRSLLVDEYFSPTTMDVLYVASWLQAFATLFVFLRPMKILYVFPSTGLLLLMTIRMLVDLRQFIFLLWFVMLSFVGALYVQANYCAQLPDTAMGMLWGEQFPHSQLYDDERFGVADRVRNYFLVVWRLLDHALMGGEPH